MNFSDDLQVRWWKLEEKLMERFGKKPDMETILFLIGIQEFGDLRRQVYQGTKTGPDAYCRMFNFIQQRFL